MNNGRGWLWPFTMFYSDARYGAFWLPFGIWNQMTLGTPTKCIIVTYWSVSAGVGVLLLHKKNVEEGKVFFCKLASWLFGCIQSMSQNCLHKMSSIKSNSLTKPILCLVECSVNLISVDQNLHNTSANMSFINCDIMSATGWSSFRRNNVAYRSVSAGVSDLVLHKSNAETVLF